MTDLVTEKDRITTDFWFQRWKVIVGFSLIAKYLAIEFWNSDGDIEEKDVFNPFLFCRSLKF